MKIILFLIGFFLMVTGISTLILYINLLTLGYTFKEYINYIIKLPAFYYVIIGFILINLALFKRKEKNKYGI